VLLRSEQLECTSKLYAQVCEAYERLALAAEDRVVKLERCLQLRLFEDKASSVSDSYCFVVLSVYFDFHVTHFSLVCLSLRLFRLIS